VGVHIRKKSRGVEDTTEYFDWQQAGRPARWRRWRHPEEGAVVHFTQSDPPLRREPPSGGPSTSGDREPRNPPPSNPPTRALATPIGDSGQESA